MLRTVLYSHTTTHTSPLVFPTGWGPYVFLGDAEGTLMRWDVSSGKLSALVVGGQGPVRRLYCAPLPANALAATPSAGMGYGYG